MRKGVLACQIYPVLLGSALKNKGIQPLLDIICELLPSPLDIPPSKALRLDNSEQVEIVTDPKAALCCLAFKVLSDDGRKLTYLRLYSGQLKPGDSVFNSRTEAIEKVARLFRMHSHKRERIDKAVAGDIVTATGLKNVLTGDTISLAEYPLQLAGLEYPEPVVSLAVEPKTVDDKDKLPPALDKLQWEDPTFRVKEDPETGQTLLTDGELHLEVVVQRLSTDFGVEVQTGRPQVVYRETILNTSRCHEVFEREIEGKLHYGEIELQLTPAERKSGVTVELPDELLEPWPTSLAEMICEKLNLSCQSGPAAGYPLTDIGIRVISLPMKTANH